MPASNDIMAFNKDMAERMEARSHSRECHKKEKLVLNKARQLKMKEAEQERAFMLQEQQSSKLTCSGFFSTKRCPRKITMEIVGVVVVVMNSQTF